MKQQSLCNLSGLVLDRVIASTASWAGRKQFEGRGHEPLSSTCRPVEIVKSE